MACSTNHPGDKLTNIKMQSRSYRGPQFWRAEQDLLSCDAYTLQRVNPGEDARHRQGEVEHEGARLGVTGLEGDQRPRLQQRPTALQSGGGAVEKEVERASLLRNAMNEMAHQWPLANYEETCKFLIILIAMQIFLDY